MMNRVQLESTIANRSRVARTVVASVVQELQDIVLESLRAGDKVSLVGFGVFHARTQKARRGKNPKTGAPVDIPESRKPAFRASKKLAEALNAPKLAPAKTPPQPGSVRALKKALIMHESMQADERRTQKNASNKKRKQKARQPRAA